MLFRFIASLLIIVTLQPLLAQQPAAQRVRASIDKLPVGGEMTVTTIDGRELHGNLSAIDSETFTMREVDLKTTLTLRYDEVAKVVKNYGRKGFGGQRISPRKRLVGGLVLLGGLVALLSVVAFTKD